MQQLSSSSVDRGGVLSAMFGVVELFEVAKEFSNAHLIVESSRVHGSNQHFGQSDPPQIGCCCLQSAINADPLHYACEGIQFLLVI